MLLNNYVNEIFSELNILYPQAKTELLYKTHYNLLVAVILSAQATDKKVNKITEILFPLAPTPEDMVKLGQIELQKIIFPLGLSYNKSNNIINLSKILIDSYNSEIPKKFEELILLPGVGRKTANVILNSLFDEKTIAVDTHVKRVSYRLGISNSTNLIIIEKELLEFTPEKWLNKAHNLLVLHGRYICIARKPQCNKCAINKYCNFFQNHIHLK